MYKMSPLRCFLLACIFVASIQNVGQAVLATHFGTFSDAFDAAGKFYDSSDPPMPGFFDLVSSEAVTGIPKFDPALGALMDIEVFIAAPLIKYEFTGSSLLVSEMIPLPLGFGGSVSILGDVGVNYETPSSSLVTVLGDTFELTTGCLGAMGDGSCTAPIGSSGDGLIDGVTSVIGTVDPADFVGTGFVDSLFVQLFLESTGAFTTEDATATATVPWDVFAGTSGVLGVTYTYSAVPEPSAFLFFGLVSTLVGLRYRSRKQDKI